VNFRATSAAIRDPYLRVDLRGGRGVVQDLRFDLRWRVMPLRRWTAVLAMSGLMVLAGCKKKPKTVPPPQAQAPTITTPAQTQPAPEQPAPTPATPEPTTNQPAAATPPTNTTAAKPPHRPRPTRKPAEKETTPVPEKDTAPAPKSNTQIAKATPPAAPPAPVITPSLPPDQVLHTRGTTDQLLQSTEQNLASIKRQLSADERDMVQQARVYITQSRSATQDGDAPRAYNLAMKAHLLSDELIKQ
jgi:hypothetical protein